MNIEQQIKHYLEDPAATTAMLQDLLDTVDVTLDDADTADRSAYRPSPGAIAQAQRLRAARGRLVDKIDETLSKLKGL